MQETYTEGSSEISPYFTYKRLDLGLLLIQDLSFFENTVYPDQLASDEAIWSWSTLFYEKLDVCTYFKETMWMVLQEIYTKGSSEISPYFTHERLDIGVKPHPAKPGFILFWKHWRTRSDGF